MSNQSVFLEAMGICQWHCRFQLPAAAPSALLVDPEQMQSLNAQPSSVTPTASEALALLSVDNTLKATEHHSPAVLEQQMVPSNTDNAGQEEAISSNTARAPTSVVDQPIRPKDQSKADLKQVIEQQAEAHALPHHTQVVPRFRYLACQINHYFCFASMPLAEQKQLSQIEVNFLKNLIFSLDQTVPTIKQSLEYKWPLFGNPQAQEGVEQAQRFFSQRIQQHQQEGSVSCILLFGDLLQQLQLEVEQLQQCLPDVQIILLPELKQVLANAQSKRQIWQILRSAIQV